MDPRSSISKLSLADSIQHWQTYDKWLPDPEEIEHLNQIVDQIVKTVNESFFKESIPCHLESKTNFLVEQRFF